MSGSTENLLQHGHLRESVESVNDSREKAIHDKGKLTQKTGNKGIINPAFIADEKHHNEEPSSPYKRATSFQQRPSSTSQPPASRRHSSPDGSNIYGVKHKPKHGLSRHHRLTSASEEDLRRKAVLNSMKAERKFQSVSHLPNGIENEAQISGRNAVKDTKNLEKENYDKNDDLRRSTKAQDQESLLSTSSRQKDYQDDNVVVALERAQLQQYKRRLTLALNERAKLTEQLQFLNSTLTNSQLSRSFDSELSDSPRLLETGSRVGESPRRPQYSSSPRYPALTGDDDTINERRLPILPSKDKTKKVERLNLKELEYSRDSDPTYAVRIVDDWGDTSAGKEIPDTITSSKEHINRGRDSFKRERRESKREDLSLAANNMWQEHLKGESFATGEEQPGKTEKSNKSKRGENKTKDENNNTKKPLTVEEFLSSENEPEKVREEAEEFDENDKAIRRVLESSSRHSPELYEPLLNHSGSQKQNERISRSARNNSKPIKDIETKSKHFESHDQDYEKLTALAGVQTHRSDAGYQYYEEMSPPKMRKPELHSQNYTKHERDRRFNYMGPPGAIRTGLNNRGSQGDSTNSRELERAPSNISDKLRYYRGVLGNQNEEKTSRDLADAFANETDPVKRREIQQQAAAEAAVLRREASELLFKAMNLERLCDPNARVRHVYIPH